MTLDALIKAVFHYRALAATLLTSAITLGLGAAADPAIKNLISGHPGIAAFFVAVYHVALAVERLLGGNAAVAAKKA